MASLKEIKKIFESKSFSNASTFFHYKSSIGKSLYRGHTFTFAAVKTEYIEDVEVWSDLLVTGLRNGQRVVVEQTIENVTFEDTEAEDTFDIRLS